MSKRGTILRCAYIDCKKTTDKRSFGVVRQLKDDDETLHSTWLKSQHDEVVCNCHYTSLRRQLAKQQQAEGVGLMEALLAAPAVVESSAPVLPSPSSPCTDESNSIAQHLFSPIQVARSSSLPAGPAPLQLSPPPPPPPLHRSTSMPLLRANHRGCDARQRKRIAFACAMSGVTWTTWNRLDASLNSHSMNKSTWYALTEEVWKTIEAVKADREAAYIQQLLTANQPIVVIADGAWSHPGFTAGQHDWVLMNAADKKAIFSIPLHRSHIFKGKVVHQGNYDDGSSKGMEGYALDIAIKKLQASGLAALIAGWVGDQDSSVLKQLRQCSAAQRWEVHLDPGHAKKNMYKALDSLFGEKQEFAGLATRILVFIMRLTKRAEKEHAQNVADMRRQFLQWLDCVVPHYTQTCGSHCPHHQRDGDDSEQIVDSTSTSKTYLNPDIHAIKIAALQSLIDRMKQSARYFIHGFNTCNVERYHRERLKLTPKLFEFWKTWAPRCALNQLFHNYGYAETHRLVLAKLDELPSWSLDIEPGNQYMAAMDRERAYHSARKSMPTYNRREDQLARDFGKRRAAHDRTSQSRGHEYQHTLPLYEEDEYGEEVTKRRKPRRSKEQIEKEKAEEEAEERRLRALFDGGDTTFTTLGVIDVNLQPKKQGRKKKGEKGEEREEEGKEKEEKMWRAADKENIQAPPSSASRKRGRDEEQVATTSTVTAGVSSALVSLSRSTVTRAIVFR
jgi:hypothetical protein